MSRPKNAPPAICLNMILRDDAHNVQRTLDSVAPYISSWVVVDTSSNDATQHLIANHMARLGIPGKFYDRPWRNFGHNRTEALILAHGHGDYIWVIDADDVLVGTPDFSGLTADAYALRSRQAETAGWRTQLFRDGTRWRYEGVTGEALTCDDPYFAERMEGDYHIESSATTSATTQEAVSANISSSPITVHGLPRLILAGHSHLVAIAGAHVFSEQVGLISGPPGDDSHFMAGPPDTTYWNTLAEVGMGADVGIIWGGNEHNVCFLFEAGAPFDFLSAHVSRMNPSAQVVSRGAIRRRFQQSMDNLDLVVRQLATAGPNRIALIGTPPPKGDNEALRAFAQLEDFFVSAAASIGQPVATLPITDPYVRLKLWYVLQEMLAEVARSRGAMFIPVPKEVQDADGFLKHEFWLSDVTHANEAYGNVMYKTVLQAFRLGE